MLNLPVINKLIVACVNLLFLSLSSLFLIFFQRIYIFRDNIQTLNNIEIFYGVIFFCLLIYLLYGFIFVVVLYKVDIPILFRAITIAILGVLFCYFLQYAFGGSSKLTLRLIFNLVNFLIVAFILPYSEKYFKKKYISIGRIIKTRI